MKTGTLNLRINHAASAVKSTALAPAVVAVAAFVVYVATLAPTVTWKHSGADSGDLATAAFTLGIPHPPGYPIFMLLASPFSHIPWLEPAGGVGLLGALAGALAVLVLALAGHDLLSTILDDPLASLVSAVVAFALAVSPALWSQATIAEIYTLNLLLVAVILWAMVSPGPRRLQFAALAFGLGLAHHLSILLLLPGAWLVLQPARRDWRTALLVLAPLLLYAYLPLRALTHPPVNWGNPSTLGGFIWEVTAAPYRSYFLAESAVDVLARLQFAARLLFDQFAVPGVALVLWGVVRLSAQRQRLAAGLGLSALLFAVYSILYVSRDSYVYLLPVYAICALWLMYGAADLASQIGASKLRWAAAGLLALLPLYNFAANYSAMDLSSDREAYRFAQDALYSAPNDALIFAEGDDPLFALTYYRYAIVPNLSRAVIASQTMLNWDWYYGELLRQAPGVELSPSPGPGAAMRTEELARGFLAAGRAVCFAESSPPLPGLVLVQEGNLHCVANAK